MTFDHSSRRTEADEGTLLLANDRRKYEQEQSGICVQTDNAPLPRACILSAFFVVLLLPIWWNLPNQHGNNALAHSHEKCQNHESFQQSAKKTVPPIFENLDVSNRQSAELLTNRLGIFSFAYFPLSGVDITYAKWEFDKENPGSSASSDPLWITTRDPVEPILYYSASLHIIMGDLEDARTGGHPSKINSLQVFQDNLQKAFLTLLSDNITTGLSWSLYFSYPGPKDTMWPDKTVVWWSIPASHKHHTSPQNSLFLSKNDRHLDNQLWGKNQPKNGDSTVEAFARLMRHQVRASQERYHDILAMDTSGHGEWATVQILSDLENINIFHKFRKIARTVGMTLDTYPEVYSPLYIPIPRRVLEFAKHSFDENIDYTSSYSYGDMFCFLDSNGSPGQYSFSLLAEDDKCAGPLFSIATMIFIGTTNNHHFSSEFFGLSDQEYQSIRAVLLLKNLLLGHREIFSKTLGCPAKHPSYKIIKTDSSTNPFDASVDNWIPPVYSKSSMEITGTVCELEDFFGSVHDLLVRIQQGSPLVNDNFREYMASTAQSLQNFTQSIDVEKVLDDIVAGLCIG